MNGKRASSRRSGLRFSAEGFPCRYKTEFEDGSGEIVNISAGGCAIGQLSVELPLQEKVLMVLALEEGKEPVEIGARVIRVDGRITALKFTQIGEENRMRLVRFFARRQREGLDSYQQ